MPSPFIIYTETVNTSMNCLKDNKLKRGSAALVRPNAASCRTDRQRPSIHLAAMPHATVFPSHGLCLQYRIPSHNISLFVRLGRGENNPARSTIWLSIWGVFDQNTRVLFESRSPPRQQNNPWPNRVSYSQAPTRRNSRSFGFPRASTALFPKQRAFQASRSQNLATSTASNPISDN